MSIEDRLERIEKKLGIEQPEPYFWMITPDKRWYIEAHIGQVPKYGKCIYTQDGLPLIMSCKLRNKDENVEHI